MFKEELHRGVGNNSTSHLAAHEVFNILGNSSETEVIFTGTLSETEEEVGRVVIFHKLPSLINNEEATPLVGTDDVPDMGKDNIHGDWTKFVFEVANIKDDHLVVDVDIGLLGENPGEGTRSVFTEALGEVWSATTHVKKGVVEVVDGRGWGLVGEWITSNTGTGVSINQGLIKVGFFVSTEGGDDLAVGGDLVTAEHKTEETVKGDEV